MRRVWLVIASASLVATTLFGCGRENYEKRLSNTLTKLEYERRVKKNLMPAANEKKFTDLAIYLQTPKDEAQAKAGQLPVGEGQFDLDASFLDPKADAVLHVLARVKQPKKPPTKGAAPAPALPPRGDFNAEVINTLATQFGASDNLAITKFKEETKRGNRFKRLMFNANDKDVEVWSLKQDNHEVALIFVYDPKLKAALSSKVQLTLETFAVGPKATRNFSGGAAEEEADAGAPIPL